MIIELRRLIYTEIDEQITRLTDALLADTAKDLGDIRSKIGQIKGLKLARDIIGKVIKENVT